MRQIKKIYCNLNRADLAVNVTFLQRFPMDQKPYLHKFIVAILYVFSGLLLCAFFLAYIISRPTIFVDVYKVTVPITRSGYGKARVAE